MKKYFNCIIVGIMFGICSAVSAADAHSGQDLLLLGESAAALGRGGTGVTSEHTGMFLLNPAAVARKERIGVALYYGDIAGEYYHPQLSCAIPTSYGVLGACVRMISIDSDAALDLEKAYEISIGGAKEFTKNLQLGFALSYLSGKDLDGTLYYPNSSLGLIYKIPFLFYTKNGFGIYEPRIGISARFGLPIGDTAEHINFTQVTAGYNLDFFRNNLFSIGIFNDVSWMDEYDDLPVKIGLQSIIGTSYILRAGLIYPQTYEYGDYTLGVGYIWEQQSFKAEFNYALVHYDDTTFVHYIGAEVDFGELDRTPPFTRIESSEKYISPNYDGIQDYVLLSINVKDRSRIKGWKLQIMDGAGSVVREYKVSERDVEQKFSLAGFISTIWRKKESLVVPETILWDGINSAGNIVPDGGYTYAFWVWDERDNYSRKKKGRVIVDRTAPRITLHAEDRLFSPNGDNNKDRLYISQKVTSDPDDMWQAGFKDASGRIVQSYSWKGANVPSRVSWDGTSDTGQELPEGLYTYFVASKDQAGNREEREISEISLTRKYEVADINVAQEYISLKKQESVYFTTELSSQSGLKQWSVMVRDEDNDLIRTISGDSPLPGRIAWDMKDNNGSLVDDGSYTYQLMATFESGNIPSSYRKMIRVDSTPPDIDLGFSPSLFSPDGDGSDDRLTLSLEAEDNFKIAAWELKINNATGVLFKHFSGEGDPPAEIIWDGRSDSNELVESAIDYTMTYIVQDEAGNSSEIKNMKLPIDVLVMVTERGLKIRISNIEFAFDSSKLIGKAHTILDRVASILDRYDKYNVVIEGHTDDIGDDEYNLKLSEERAKAVYDYLVDKGVSEERLTFRGMGETLPYLPNKDKESRRKNRRVEFLLEKKEKSE